MTVDPLAKLETSIGHQFADRNILHEALSHSSHIDTEHSYERLEFLGDRVLGLLLADHFYAAFPQDDEGALKLAKLEYPRTTPQSKHYGIKYHWFREKSSELNLQLHHISTDKQKADIMTKGLPPSEHQPKRKLLNGW